MRVILVEIVGVVGLRPHGCVYNDCEWILTTGMPEATSVYLRIFENLGKTYQQREFYQIFIKLDKLINLNGKCFAY